MSALAREISAELPTPAEGAATSLARNYGSNALALIGAADQTDLAPVGDTDVLAAQIRHAVRHEMAMTISDILLRRTDLATGGISDADLLDAAGIARDALSLPDDEYDRQLAAVQRRIPGW